MGCSPQKATSGELARLAVSSAVASCDTPGPQVAVATPGVCIARAQPSAMPSPAPSWRTSSSLTPSLSSSCIQYMLPSPMMPKTAVQPSDGSHSYSDARQRNPSEHNPRALFNRPPLLLCDEPTGNLDTNTGQQIIELFTELNSKDGISLVIVTHESRVSSAAHRVIRLEDGRITGAEGRIGVDAPQSGGKPSEARRSMGSAESS